MGRLFGTDGVRDRQYRTNLRFGLQTWQGGCVCIIGRKR